MRLLIALITWHVHAIFGMLIRPKENSGLYQFEGECWNLRCKRDTSIGALGTDLMREVILRGEARRRVPFYIGHGPFVDYTW